METLPPLLLPLARRAWALLVLLLWLPAAAGATGTPGSPGATTSLATALNPDGTLRPGVSGSFDPAGFELATTPDGRPAFRPARTTRTNGADDAKWQDGFGAPGVVGEVYASAVAANGDLYIGGTFYVAGLAAANRVAKWDGTAWSALGSGVNNTVSALAISGTDVYVGGTFTTAGGSPANRVAKWNGTAWSALGSGVDNSVNALVVNGTDVYVGGYFTSAGGVAANRVAKWDGSTWSSLGTGTANGVNNYVSALAVTAAGTVYVGGNFTQAGGQAAGFIAQWDGTAWGTLNGGATGMYSNITSLALSASGDLYASGYFTSIGGTAASYIARWNGSAWSALGSGVVSPAFQMAVASTGDLYVATPASAGSVTLNGVGRWNGSTWSALGTGATGSTVRTIAVGSSGVYAGGNFSVIGGQVATGIARWDGTGWGSLGQGLQAPVRSVAISGSTIYAAYAFSSPAPRDYVVQWNGTSWAAVGNSFNGFVNVLAVDGSGQLYAGGNFTQIGGQPIAYLAKWNGTAWATLGTGVVGNVLALTFDGTTLYAGGDIGQAGGTTVAGIAKWDGSTWSRLSGGVQGQVRSIAVASGYVYVGGGITSASGVTTNRVARWNGTSWSALGAGLTTSTGTGYSFVYALATAPNGDLYVGGDFDTAGTGAARNVAKWSGSTWSALGSGTSDPVTAVAATATAVYAGGLFSTAGGVAAPRVAKWNGTAWSSMGTGLNGNVGSLVLTTGNRVVASGYFTTVGDGSKVTAYVGIYTDTPAPTITNFTPPSGPVGTSVTLTGTNFTGTTAVAFNAVAAAGFVVNSASQITVAVPAGASTGPISVTTPGGTASSSSFTVVVPGPAVTSVAVPTSASYHLGQTLTFGVVFDGPVTVTGTPVLGLVIGSNSSAAATYQSGSGTTGLIFRYTITGSDLAPSGIGLAPALSLNGGTIASTASSSTAASLTLNNVPTTGGILVDGVRPYIASAVRFNPGTATATGPAVTFRVVFNEVVTGVVPAAFVAVGTGGVSGTVSTVVPLAGSSSTYDVTFTGVNGDGTLRLTAPGTGSALITDSFTNTYLATSSVAGETYTIIPGDLTVSTPQTVSGVYANVAVNSGGVATLTGPLQVRGRVTVSSGGSFFSRRRSGFWWRSAAGGSPNATDDAGDACNVVTGPGSFTVEAGATVSVCDAAGLTLSGATGMVQVTGTRSFSPDARYVYDADAAQVTGAGLPTQVRSLLLDNAAGLTLSQPLAVRQVLELTNGSITTNSRMLTLLSSATGTALVVNTNGVVTGTATVQRYLSDAVNAGPGYRHLAAPVGNTTVADLATSTFTPTVNSSYNTSATPNLLTPFPTVFGYDQARLGTSLATGYSFFDRGWESPAALGSPLAVGRGYTVNMAAGQVVDFVGNLTSGNQLLNLARGPQADAGWQLVGNPYPAPLDWSLVTQADRPGLDAAMYVAESTGPYAGRYRSFINSIGNPVLPLGQAFFVRVSDGQVAGTLTLRNAHRLTTAEGTPLLRPADLRPQLHLELQGAGTTDLACVYFETGATPGFDPAYDARKLPNGTGLNLAAQLGGVPQAIAGLPLLTAATTVPLQVEVPAASRYTLAAAALLNLPAGTQVYLRDALTGQQTDLQQQPSYAFAATGTQLAGRFTLEFRPATVTATAAQALAEQVLVYPNPASAHFQVQLPAGTGPATLALYNALGQQVRTQTVRNDHATVAVAGLATGVYTLRVQAAGTAISKRLVVE